MLSLILAIALWSTTTFALVDQKRQATNAEQFTSAAEQLISQYIPSTALPAFEASVSAAASAANVAGEPLSLIYDALLASSFPGWFESAVPTEWASQIAALESGVNALRPPIAVAVTTTDSDGSTFITSVFPTRSLTGPATATITETSGITTTTDTTLSLNGGSIYSSLTTEVIGGVTSVFEVAVTGASSVATEASGVYSSLTTQVIGGVTSVFGIAVSGASSVATEASGVVSHASSVATEASGAVNHASSVATEASGFLAGATSTGGAGFPTAVSGAAAGVIGIVGLMIAL